MMRVVVVVILAGVLLTQGAGGACLSAQAQERGGQPARPLPIQRPGQNVMRVRGTSGKGPVQNGGIRVPDKPRPLTPGEKLSLANAGIAKFVANMPWTLTPAKPILPNRGSLSFINPMIVTPGINLVTPGINQPVAVFKSQSEFLSDLFSPINGIVPEDKSLSVTIKGPVAGKHYLIDCTVVGGETYYVRVLPGGAMQTFSGTNHIVVFYEATSNTDVEIAIIAKTSDYWVFYSAEITPFD